jgi:peptidoglycan/LPS O-acetylase OafA/YrhL
MIGSGRRKIGVLAMLAPLVALPMLAVAGVPLVTGSSVYFAETGVTTHSLHWHWPLALVAFVFLVGVVLTIFPGLERRPFSAAAKAGNGSSHHQR